MDIPEIVKEHALKQNGRMPETQDEVNPYLDLINHLKEYKQSLILSHGLSKGMMKRLGFRTPSEIKKQVIL